MEKCKYCQENLEEGSTVCPHCGKDNAAEEMEQPVPVTEEVCQDIATEEIPAQESSAEIREKAKVSPAKIAISAAAVVVLAAVLIAFVVSGLTGKEQKTGDTTPETTQATVPATIPADGNPDDATCKGTYTVTDEEVKAASNTVVATMGDKQLTNGQLQVYYWNMVNSYLNSEYGYYMMLYGVLDYTQPLDTQISVEDESMTWQQFFLMKALDYWQLHQSLANEAESAGLEMSQQEREYLDNLEASLLETAQSYGIDTVEELLARNVGPGADLEDFSFFQELYYTGKPFYLAKTEAMVPTQEDLEAFFAQHESEYEANGITKDGEYVDVRHILLTVEGGTTDENGTTTYSDENWENCRVKAQEVLDAWLAGEKTEESFATLANEKSQDPGSNTNGGLYENVYVGQMVEPFENWCFDESRKTGDYGLVQTSYGYHVMYYVTSRPIWETYAKSDWTSEQANQLIADLAQAYPMEVDYSAIVLGYIDLAG